MTGAPLSTRVIALSIVEFSRRTIWCRVRRGNGRGHYRRKITASVLPVSRFDFGGQIREEGDIAVEFLRQTTDYTPRRHHLAVDHLKQLHRVDADISVQPERIRAPGRAQSTPQAFRRWDVSDTQLA
jgi:hypothetical protein